MKKYKHLPVVKFIGNLFAVEKLPNGKKVDIFLSNSGVKFQCYFMSKKQRDYALHLKSEATKRGFILKCWYDKANSAAVVMCLQRFSMGIHHQRKKDTENIKTIRELQLKEMQSTSSYGISAKSKRNLRIFKPDIDLEKLIKKQTTEKRLTQKTTGKKDRFKDRYGKDMFDYFDKDITTHFVKSGLTSEEILSNLGSDDKLKLNRTLKKHNLKPIGSRLKARLQAENPLKWLDDWQI